MYLIIHTFLVLPIAVSSRSTHALHHLKDCLSHAEAVENEHGLYDEPQVLSETLVVTGCGFLIFLECA